MLRLSNIKKSFSGIEVLHDVSFSIKRGCVTALVGENGAGKSTLMKILSGVYTEYGGEVFIGDKKIFFNNTWEAKQAGISIIHQELSCIPDLTVAENIFLGNEPLRKFGFVNFPKLFNDAEDVLDDFDFPYPPNMLVRQLSVGWQQIVEIAHALSYEADIFILDEPTSALTESEIKILFEKIRLLKERGKIIIFISHRLEEIYEIADEIVVLRDGLLIGQYVASEICRNDLISKMVGREIIEKKQNKLVDNKEYILRVSDLGVFDENRLYFSDVSFDLKKGEKLGLAGLLGSGKSELLKFLFGELKAKYRGRIILNKKNYIPRSASNSIIENIFYLSKDRKSDGIFAGMDIIQNSSITVLDNYASFGFINEEIEKEAVISMIDKLNVKYNSLHQPIELLSGGNQQKVLLGRGLLNKPKLLLLDEPTRGIDIGAKEEIYNLINRLSSDGVSFIISSSEIPELLRICDRVIVMFRGMPTAVLNTFETNTEEILHHAFYED